MSDIEELMRLMQLEEAAYLSWSLFEGGVSDEDRQELVAKFLGYDEEWYPLIERE